MPIFAVALGGALGALGRYALVSFLGLGISGFPWATLIINLSGSLLIGLWYVLGQELAQAAAWRLFIQMGCIGAFTTFSSVSLELLLLIETRNYVAALGYAFISIVGGLLLAFIGIYLARLVL